MKRSKEFGMIYLITCIPTGKLYVGQTTQLLRRRFSQHINSKPKLTCPLSLAIRKYGRSAFTVTPIEVDIPVPELNEAERYWVAWYNTIAPLGLNATSGGDVSHRFSEVSRRRMSESNKGRKHSEETRRKMSESHKACEPKPLEWINNLRAAAERRKGVPRTPEDIAKMRAGKRHLPLTEEHKAKIRAAAARRKELGLARPPTSEETRQRVSESHKGHVPTPEQRAKLSASLTESWARRKAQSDG